MSNRLDWDRVNNESKVRKQGYERIKPADRTTPSRRQRRAIARERAKGPPGIKIRLSHKTITLSPLVRKDESIEVAREEILRIEDEKAQRKLEIAEKSGSSHTPAVSSTEPVSSSTTSEVRQTIRGRSKPVLLELRPIPGPGRPRSKAGQVSS